MQSLRHVDTRVPRSGRRARAALACLAAAFACGPLAPARAVAAETATVALRGHPQTLQISGTTSGPPVIVSSGDGGWVHLAPHVAELLASRGYFVVGFDVKAYLESFTTNATTLRRADEPADFKVLADYAAARTGRRPVLAGVSEGAGLSVLAATDASTRSAIAGVLGLGLPDINELGWRWRDAVIYVTHGTPNEPTFSTRSLVALVAPVPLAAVHSTHDEFVPLDEVEAIMANAREPKRLWVVTAANHRFSDNLAALDRAVLEALTWMGAPSRR